MMQQPVKLLEFINLFGLGGTERQLVNLLKNIDERRFAVSLGCLHKWGELLAEIEAQKLPLFEYHIRHLYGGRTMLEQLHFMSLLRRERIQIVHTQGFYPNVFALPAAKLARVPVTIASVRDLGNDLSSAQARVQNATLAMADAVVVNAEVVRQKLVGEGVAPEKIACIHNGIDMRRFSDVHAPGALRQSLGISATAPLVVVVARLDPVKGIEYFIDAAALVLARAPDTRFVVVGAAGGVIGGVPQWTPAYQTELEGRARSLGLEGALTFVGARTDIPAILAECTLAVLPSVSEGLSNTLIESMAVGLPVVATRVGGNAEVVDDGVTGLLVPPCDAAALAGAISTLLADRALATQFGHAGRARVQARFSLERMVRDVEQLYESLLSKKTKGLA